ncbi:heterokaryon incompatibility protein-domain-containing protein [Hypoxylon rubiginosum]|uniref:Heterokaryon incompatibility protein-domain-containing protein n=1 Tax=Hypoxylon rubiginosum TaxID=110542 RepID=A0ACB9YZJ5_9PEZI|nr:heterokaryon incompatibility protein-domain-containing protein [Hypoxylon rubiginosum]
MSLCSKCSSLDVATALRQAQATPSDGQQIFRAEVKTGGWYSRTRDVFASASTCQLCRLVVRGWRDWRPRLISIATGNADFDPKDPPSDLYAAIEDIYKDAKVEVGVVKRYRFHSEGQKWSFILRISCSFGYQASYEVHGELVARFRVTYPAEKGHLIGHDDVDIGIAVDRDSTSVSVVNTAKTWLDTCLTKHQSCPSQTQTVALPFRYLDVNDGIHSDRIFLRDSGVEPDHRYVALSHCWGTAEQLCTTSTTLQSHKEGIPIQILPQTFKDAVRVVREVGLRYLWIDSLCIIQDDIEDWRKESEKMAEVYRNAHFVLAAARSSSDSEGFLSPRQGPEHVELVASDGKGFSIEALPCDLLQPTYDAHPIDNEPLSRRAWCLQERYLARRVLHYGLQQIYWECGEIHAAENGDFASVVGDQFSRIGRSAAAKETVFTGLSDSDYFNYVDWYNMIEDYTGRDITKDSDRLPALFGLAKALEVQTGDKYLIGIWLNGLLEGLMWCAASTDNLLARPRSYSAPSWAWVSVKGQVQFPIYSWYERRAGWKGSKANFEPLAEYANETFEKRDVEPSDRLPDSELCLYAPIVPIRRFKQRTQTPPDSGSQFGLAPERSLIADQAFYFQYHDVDGRAHNIGIDGAFDIKEEERTAKTNRLYIVFLTRLPFVLQFDFLEHRFGLVVEKHETSERYRRVGFVDGCLISEGSSALWDRLVPRKWRSDNPVVCAFKRDHKDGDMGSNGVQPDFNLLAPDPLQLRRQRVSLI